MHAPGSGRRRSINSRGMKSSSQRMQHMLRATDAQEPASSSPLARKSRRSDVTAAGSIVEQSPRSSRLSRAVIPDDGDDVDELSPNALKTAPQEEEAEAIDDSEAARILGRKRPRRSTAPTSPLFVSQDEVEESPREESAVEEEPEEPESAAEEPPPKRQRRKPQASPAKQKQPAKKQRAPRRKKGEKAAKPRPADTSADEMGNDPAAVIPITVQRFKKPRRRQTEDSEEDDLAAADIPFTNQKGVNVVDVLAQSAEEVIG
ncbi:hypothetical protein IMZ48_30010, partial [Candidatus Bathyarchaeota archaeon]|nr:hypothetical protein [Candidatus Bathyarchaeota archaeon]